MSNDYDAFMDFDCDRCETGFEIVTDWVPCPFGSGNVPMETRGETFCQCWKGKIRELMEEISDYFWLEYSEDSEEEKLVFKAALNLYPLWYMSEENEW